MRQVLGGLVISMLVVACSGSGGDDGSDAAATTTVLEEAGDDDLFDPSTEDMRPVPTLAPSTIAGQQPGDEDDGVIEAAPTIVPGPSTTAADGEVAAPPSTDLVGDPQPSPDTTAAPPPATIDPPPAACERLVGVGVADEIAGFASPVDAANEFDDGCRFEAGLTVVEVRFVPLDEVRDDWFRRDGIEPVAEAGGDAVGLDGFRGVDGSTGDGYTVAATGGGEGVVVSVTGSAAPRLIAAFVSVLAAQAA